MPPPPPRSLLPSPHLGESDCVPSGVLVRATLCGNGVEPRGNTIPTTPVVLQEITCECDLGHVLCLTPALDITSEPVTCRTHALESPLGEHFLWKITKTWELECVLALETKQAAFYILFDSIPTTLKGCSPTSATQK